MSDGSKPLAINDAAARGFERGAEDYEKARPSYPDDAVAFVVEQLELGPARRLLDLAAGTGKFTRLVQPTGVEIIAVEPVAGMREQLQAVLPDVAVLDGTAEAIPLGDASVDAVTVAQAFHWFDATKALAEIGRVLKPGGGLALIWNVRDETVDWVRQYTEITIRHSGGTPYRRDYSFQRWQEEFDGARSGSSSLFGELQSRRFRYEQDVDIELVLARASSTSFVSAMSDDARQATLDEIRAMLEAHPELQGRAVFPFPYETDVYWCHRL